MDEAKGPQEMLCYMLSRDRSYVFEQTKEMKPQVVKVSSEKFM